MQDCGNVNHREVFCRFGLQAGEGYIRHHRECYVSNCAGLLRGGATYSGESFQGCGDVIHQVVFCRFKLQAGEGYIRHYRECYTTDCAGLSWRKNDTSAAVWSKKIEANVKAARQKIFGSQNAI